MHRLLLLALVAVLAACDGPIGDPPPTESSGPAGVYVIEPVFFRLHYVTDAANGYYEDLQATISGELRLEAADGALTGTGSCRWTTRRNQPRLGQVSTAEGLESFSARGSISEDEADLELVGCAWPMLRYRGTFDGRSYVLALRDPSVGPLFDPDVWYGSRLIEGDDPSRIVLKRK